MLIAKIKGVFDGGRRVMRQSKCLLLHITKSKLQIAHDKMFDVSQDYGFNNLEILSGLV